MKWIEMYITYIDPSNYLPISTKRIYVNPSMIVAVSAGRRETNGKVLSLNIVFANVITLPGVHYEFRGEKNIANILEALSLTNAHL